MVERWSDIGDVANEKKTLVLKSIGKGGSKVAREFTL